MLRYFKADANVGLIFETGVKHSDFFSTYFCASLSKELPSKGGAKIRCFFKPARRNKLFFQKLFLGFYTPLRESLFNELTFLRKRAQMYCGLFEFHVIRCLFFSFFFV